MRAPTLRKDAVRTRASLLSAAEELLAEDREASLTEIAVAAGVSHTTIYRHFADRTDLLLELMELRMDRHEAEVADWEIGPESFERLLRLIAVEGARFQGLVAEVRRRGADSPRYANLRHRTTELFRRPLEVAQAAGTVSGETEPEGMVALLMMIDGPTSLPADAEARKDAAEEAVDVVMRGIA
jgi:AcrR family transcriptional regulator